MKRGPRSLRRATPWIIENDLAVRHAAALQNILRNEVVFRSVVLVVEIDDLADARLNKRLRTLMAGEQRHVDRSMSHILQGAAVVENRVRLGMDNIVVLVMQGVVSGAPRKVIVPL